MTATLLLERLMLDPSYPEIVEELRALLPAHVVDQADAANADAYRTTLGLAALLGGQEDVHGAAAGDVPGWLRLNVIDAYVGYVSGRADTCRHNPDPSRPEPVLAAAWRPGLISCRGCVFLFATVQGSTMDRTCDGCGRVCAGVDAGDPIYPSMVQLGPVIFQYGACAGCHQEATTSRSTTNSSAQPGRRQPRSRRR